MSNKMKIVEKTGYGAAQIEYEDVRDFVDRKLDNIRGSNPRVSYRNLRRTVAILTQILADKGILNAEQVLEIATGYKTHVNIEVLTQQED